MDVQELRDDAAAGKLSIDKLIDVIAAQQKLIASQQNRIDELEAIVKSKNPTQRLDQPYSEKAEQKRKGSAKKRRRKPLRRGRISTADKIKLAARTEPIYPDVVAADQCKLSHTRVVWRLENGRAVLVAYEIYRHRNRFGKPPGVIGRSEFGVEITVAIAYQVYCLGLSIDKGTFAGVVVSDDAAVYQAFSKAQKCWAHLIRKAIKLTLQDPGNKLYRHFADRLLEIYNSAKRVAADGRLGDAGRASRVAELDDEVLALCGERWIDDDTSGSEVENDYRRLSNEIMRLMLGQELFVFVTEAGVEGNNNAAERQLRDDALARKTDRTSKTVHGAKRRSVISSVLQSISKQLENFTLESVIGEAQRWLREGSSCFKREVEERGLSPPARDRSVGETDLSLLERLVLRADT